MNREDAVKVLKSLVECMSIDCDDDCEHCHIQLDGITAVVEACAVAVTELSQIDTNTVSRKDVSKWLAKWKGYISDDMVARMQYRVIDIPSALSNAQKALDDDCQQAQSVGCVEDDTISRGAAIEAVKNALDPNIVSFVKAKIAIENLPPAPESTEQQVTCEYCHEDAEGYVKPIEKNNHAFVRFGMNGWELSLKGNGWHGEASINFCPMCGRKLMRKDE